MSPKFRKIQNIIHIPESEKVLFCIELYQGFAFCTHYNAFRVSRASITSVTDVISIQDHHSLLVRKSFNISDSSLYIVMPYIF